MKKYNDTDWLCQVLMLCPAKFRRQASQRASQMSGNPNDNKEDFFGRPVRVIGTQEIAYYAAHSHMRKIVHDNLPNLEKEFDGAKWIVTNHKDESIETKSVEEFLSSLNLEFADKEDTLIIEKGKT